MGSHIIRIDPHTLLAALGLEGVELDDVRIAAFVGRCVELSIRHSSFPETRAGWDIEVITGLEEFFHRYKNLSESGDN